MYEHTIKHLELIQNVITRMAQNSFAYKAWAITLVAAIFVLWANNAQPYFLLVALIPAITFWGLDACYHQQERLFRKLYDAVRKSIHQKPDDPFSMDTTPYRKEVASWWSICWSRTIAWLYGPILVLILLVTTLACIYQDC